MRAWLAADGAPDGAGGEGDAAAGGSLRPGGSFPGGSFPGGASVALRCVMVLAGTCPAPVTSLLCGAGGAGGARDHVMRDHHVMLFAGSRNDPEEGGRNLFAWSALPPFEPAMRWGPDRPHGQGVSAMALAAGGRRLLSAGMDGALHVRCAADGRRIALLTDGGAVCAEDVVGGSGRPSLLATGMGVVSPLAAHSLSGH